MSDKILQFRVIGVIRTPFENKADMPIQANGNHANKGAVELFPEFVAGLKDLDGFSHVILLYYFHLSHGYQIQTKPFLDEELRGVFATRAPQRPNQIGMSVVKLISIDGNVLHVENVDMLNETPLLDIKPYVPQFDVHQADRWGWLQNVDGAFEKTKSDNRFK